MSWFSKLARKAKKFLEDNWGETLKYLRAPAERELARILRKYLSNELSDTISDEFFDWLCGEDDD